MMPATIHSWFKPTHTFEIEGARWCASVHMALVMQSPGELREPDPAKVIKQIDSARPRESVVPTRTNGYAVLDGKPFNGYFIAACEAAYPELVWRLGDGSAVGFCGDSPVAVVMGMREGTTTEEEQKPPECPACEGHGGPICRQCRGEGRIDCTCSECGDPHDRKCQRCGGKGSFGTCAQCKGTGTWAPPEASAA